MHYETPARQEHIGDIVQILAKAYAAGLTSGSALIALAEILSHPTPPTGGELALMLGISRAAAWKAITQASEFAQSRTEPPRPGSPSTPIWGG